MKVTANPAGTVGGDTQSIYLLGRCDEFLRIGHLLPYLAELLADRALISAIEAAVVPVAGWQTKKFSSLYQFRFYRILLYAIVRALRPTIVVETGVLHGMTTSFILQALVRNGDAGKLISVDLPSYFETGPANRDGYDATLPEGKQSGWMVPMELRKDWQLIIGSSCEVLPRLPQRMLDLFIHDSEHTYETMEFELTFAWERLRDGGILVCDNTDSCDAFADFCRKVNRKPLSLPAPDQMMSDQIRFGLLRK